MPLLGNVLDPWLADVVYQHEGQSICVRPAKFIYARAFAIFRGYPFVASLLDCHGIAGHRIGTPDLCFWLGSGRVKRSVGIDRPDRAE